MKQNEKINQFVNDALNSLDGLQRAAPAPYLLTRINQRLQSAPETVWEKLVWFIGRPAVALPGLALILALNVLAIVNHNKSVNNTAEQVTSSTADDYSITVATIYDSENP